MMENVDKEKQIWEDQKARISEINAIKNDIIELNVSGVTEGFTVTKSLMRTVSGSYLDAMFSGNFSL